MRLPRTPLTVAAAFLLAAAAFPATVADEPLGFEQLAAIRSVGEVRVAADGERVAFTVSVPRRPGEDEDGPAWQELHVVSWNGASKAYIRGSVNVSQLDFTPDGLYVTYLAKREGDEQRALWAIPLDGGESVRVLEFDTAIEDYAVSPDGSRLAFVAVAPEDEARKTAKDKGYSQEVFEEDWRPRRVWLTAMPPLEPQPATPGQPVEPPAPAEPSPLALDGSAFHVTWGRDGKTLALDVAPRPLIDDRYMLRRVHIVDADTGETRAALDNPGKLGRFEIGPDGAHVAMISAADPNDPSEGRLLVAPAAGGALRDLLPGLDGHVTAFAWRDAATLVYLADVGVETELGEVYLDRRPPRILLASGDGVPVLTALSLADNGRVALVGESAAHPSELFLLAPDGAPRRITDSNPWLAQVSLARQEVVSHTARDGLGLQGILIHPLMPPEQGRAPLILIVHGGPEGHVRNGWVTGYSRPGQLAAGRGYAVFYPNYRGSTGRGVAFSKLGQSDAAGKEFDDLIDAVDHLAAIGVVDPERVGITGGSYGGFATAWCATRFSERFRAGVMFVGISNKISKGLTTEIPLEDEMVHTRFDPWTKWQFSLERSPIYYAEQSRTALLIAGGTADERVHPSQSLQLYRALKLIGKTPVRYVRYPGEGHGNRRAAARDDYARRLMRWMDHYVVGSGGEPPPWDLGLGAEPAAEQTPGEGSGS